MTTNDADHRYVLGYSRQAVEELINGQCSRQRNYVRHHRGSNSSNNVCRSGTSQNL